MTSPYKVYTIFMALRAHFTTPKYDYFLYKGSLKWVSEKSYERRKDKYIFERLAKRKDYKEFIVANLHKNPKMWVTGLMKPEAENVYLEWTGKLQSLGYIFKNEIAKLPDDLIKLMAIPLGTEAAPPLLLHYSSNEISLETLCILLDLTKMKQFLDEHVKDLAWEQVSQEIDKYLPFIRYDKEKMKSLVLERFKGTGAFLLKEFKDW